MTLLERAILRTLGESPKTTGEILIALRLSRRTSHSVVMLVCARLRSERRIQRAQTKRKGVHRWFLLSINRVTIQQAKAG